MQRIGGKTIVLTKGDTFKATVSMIGDDGTPYEPETGDVIRFAMKQNYEDAQLLIEKEIPHDTLLLKLDPQDTKNLDAGEYVYDIEITYENGDVDTFIDRATLKLTEEVEGLAPVPVVTNIVQGKFTTTGEEYDINDVDLGYTGSGYPISMTIYVDGGLSSWEEAPQYTVAQFSLVKYQIGEAPAYNSSSSANGVDFGSVTYIYQDSDDESIVYDDLCGIARCYVDDDVQPGSGLHCIKIIDNGKKIRYRNYKHSGGVISNGLRPNETYSYVVAYSGG